MEKKTVSNQTLAAYLDQKLILLTKISDLTKQIEVQSSQTDIQLGDLPEKRQIYIDRLKKCEQMIHESYQSMAGEQKERRKKILNGDFSKKDCTVEEAGLLACAIQCRSVLLRTLAMDRDARGLIQKECDRLQNLLHTARKKRKNADSKHYQNDFVP